ncbi:MAG: helix-turn-helix domain-containing protein [Desulfovibrio sp.]
MNRTLCKELTSMLADGWVNYEGVVDGKVYQRLGCKKPERVYWVTKWPLMHCLGCVKRCTANGTGFQAPIIFPSRKMPKFGEFNITPAEMIKAKPLLRVPEAAYCLNVSERTIRKMIDEGVLIKHNSNPMRVTSESVLAEIENVDW